MSDSVNLWKTRAIIQLIIAFIALSLMSGGIASIISFPSIEACVIVSILFIFFFCSLLSAYDNFIQAGTYISKEEREKEIAEKLMNDITDSTLQNSVDLRKLYANIHLTVGFLIFALLIFFTFLAIFSKTFLYILIIAIIDFGFSFIIYAFIYDGCDYLMKAGIYLKELEELEDRNLK